MSAPVRWSRLQPGFYAANTPRGEITIALDTTAGWRGGDWVVERPDGRHERGLVTLAAAKHWVDRWLAGDFQ